MSNQVHRNSFMSACQTVPKSLSSSVMVKLLRSSQMVGMTEDTLSAADLLIKWTVSKHRDANWNVASRHNTGFGILVGKERMLDTTT
jgi:folate-dependent tRNA-U54 methylase TrmFO/GidA